MMSKTSLLCTFCERDALDKTLSKIIETYDIAFDTIYVLENVDLVNSLCLTYNIYVDSPVGPDIPKTTISLHRKKITNTLYTINALNRLVAELNNGKLDNKFVIPWENYRNTILVTAYDDLKKINTRLDKIIKVSDLKK